MGFFTGYSSAANVVAGMKSSRMQQLSTKVTRAAKQQAALLAAQDWHQKSKRKRR